MSLKICHQSSNISFVIYIPFYFQLLLPLPILLTKFYLFYLILLKTSSYQTHPHSFIIILNMDQSLKHLCANYQIHNQLGKGTFSTVYLAIDPTNQNRQVALKCINIPELIQSEKNPSIKELKQRLLQSEVQIMNSFESKNILKCYDVIQNKDWRVLVLEFCKDGSLFDQIQKKGRINQQEAVNILGQLIVGFADLHIKKIIHRDLKTQNILVDDRVYKIADFGMAKGLKEMTRSQQGSLLGSKFSMAPEVLRGQNYDSQADIWSLGVIYYQVLTGCLPFNGVISNDSIKQAINKLGEYQISDASKKIIQRLFVIDSKQRLKWSELYEIYNQKKSVFENLESRHHNTIQEGFNNALDQHNHYEQNGQIYKNQNKQQVQNLKTPVPQKYEEKIPTEARILESNIQTCQTILSQTVCIIQRCLKVNPTNICQFTRLLNCFCLLIFSQIDKILCENKQYEYTDTSLIRQQVEPSKLIQLGVKFNQFNQSVRKNYNRCLIQFEELNSKKSFLNSMWATLTQSKVFSKDQILDIKSIYVPYECKEQQHISYTNKMFRKLYLYIQQKYNDNQQLMQDIQEINEFMEKKYEQLLRSRQRK